MRTLNVKLSYSWDDGDDTREYHLSVPETLTDDEIMEILGKEHDALSMDDELSDIYGYEGRNPDTLMKYVCEKYHWEFGLIDYALDLVLV